MRQTNSTGTTANERKQHKRDEKLEKMREQIASGDLQVRQMTSEERAQWDEHSAASARDASPAERVRRSAALQKRHRVQEMRRERAG